MYLAVNFEPILRLVRRQVRLRRRPAYAALNPVPRSTSVAGSGVGAASWNSYLTVSETVPKSGRLRNSTEAVPPPRNAPEKIGRPVRSTLSCAVRNPEATNGTCNVVCVNPPSGGGAAVRARSRAPYGRPCHRCKTLEERNGRRGYPRFPDQVPTRSGR